MKAMISKFRGLDVRRLAETSDPRSARVASNLDLTQGGEYTARDPVEELMDLDPQSVGLYALGGTLRAAIPGGQNIPLAAVGPVHVKYDALGFGIGSYIAVMVGMTNTAAVRLQGTTWPAWSVGATLTVGAYTATVLSVVGDTATTDTVFTDTPALYPFTLVNGGNNLASRTVAVTTDSSTVTLTNGTWPLDIEGATFSITRANFTARVVSRASATQLLLDTTYPGAALSGVEFVLGGVADAYPLDTLIRVSAVESVGANASFGVYPYLTVERWIDAADESRGTTYEHHWIQQDPDTLTSVVATQVPLPFTPGASLIKASGKVFADDDVNGIVRFCSTANGPLDWTTPEDAGYIPVITHATGDRRIQGLGIYDEKMAVIFSDAVQLWATDPQPTNITLVRVINGPGTTQSRSAVNVLGDMFYLTRGGFRSLHTAVTTGQIQEQDDIGTPIDDLVQAELTNATAALWSQTRGQYLCAVGPRIYAFRYSPKTKIMGWTTWEMGFEIAAMAENAGILYLRSAAHKLYRLNETSGVQPTFELRLNDFTGRDPSVRKRIDFMEVMQRGEATTRFYTEPDDDTIYTDGPTLDGSTIGMERVFVGVMSRTAGLRFTGTGPWTLSAVQLTYIDMGF